MITETGNQSQEIMYRIVMRKLRGRKALEKNLWRIEFYAHSKGENLGISEYKLKTNINDVLPYLHEIGLKYARRKERIIIETTEWEKYAKILLYAAIVSTIRKKYRKSIVNLEMLSFFDLKYWTGIITSIYRRQGYRATQRPIRALKTLLGFV